MEAKKIISSIIIMFFIVISCIAQKTSKEVNKFEKFQDRLKKGNSTIAFNINLMQLIETGDSFYLGLNPSIEYSYFIINKLSINVSVRYVQQSFSFYRANAPSIHSQKSIDIGFRYYFFKRGGFFLELGGSLGHLLIDNVDEFGRKFYAAPKINIGYSYMITNVWSKIDNKMSLIFAINSYVPYKKQANFDVCDRYLPFFPFFSTEIGVVYYFIRK